MMKKNNILRSLAMLACVVGVSGLCMAGPVAAQSGGFSWGSGSSNQQSQSHQSQSQSGSFSWGSGSSSKQSQSQQSFQSQQSYQSHQSAQPSKLTMPDPYTRISSAELRNLVKQSRGKVVLVNFFASWCGPCRQEIPALKSLRNKMSQDDLVIIGVSIDSKKSDLSGVIRDMNFNYPTVWASDELTRTYNVTSIPRLIIYDRDGMLVTDDTGLVPEDALHNFIRAIVNY